MKVGLYPLVYLIQRFLQKVLYKLSNNYRLEVSKFFDALKNDDYVVVKLDTPNIHENFPFDYKIGTDIDLIVLDTSLGKIKNKIIELNKCKNLKCVLVENDLRVRIRYHYFKFLHFQFDLTACSVSELYNECLKSGRIKGGIKVPEVTYEIILRAIEFQNKPQKKHHLNYIVKNKDYTNFDLLSNNGIQSSTLEKIKNS